MRKGLGHLLFLLLLGCLASAQAGDIEERVQHGYANNNGVKLHYVALGHGPLVIMLHGFPDYWYTWRFLMGSLADNFQTVAVDLRGYNLSDKPKGVENYDMALLVEDVSAVIRQCGQDHAIVIGHDWGGLIAWNFAMSHPEQTDKLIVLNLPHPRGLNREFIHNPQQQENSKYAHEFQKPGAERELTPEGLAGWMRDPAAREKYVAALRRSDFEAMLNYYRRNYPREPVEDTSPVQKVRSPVLLIHGLQDKALLPGALNDTWQWVESDLTILTVPGAGHFVQQDAADLVNSTIKSWLCTRVQASVCTAEKIGRLLEGKPEQANK
jgi:pimeloyl-ACP methyl ester carboxylesterase